MRILGEIPHSQVKITLFAWNNKYLIKLERGSFEQTFKVPEFDLVNEGQLQKIVDKVFLTEAIQRFDEMEKSFFEALQRT